MDTVPLYRASYVRHCAPPARTCRPPPALPVDAPLSKATEHRENFIGEVVDICPAAALLQRVPGCVVAADVEGPPGRWNRGIGRYRYSERDDVGHEWYMFEEGNVPGAEKIHYDADRYVRGDSLETVAARQAAARAMTWTPPQPTALPVVA